MKGLIHIYTGRGKGKTTAAMGLAVRCAGSGGRVLVTQMLKKGTSSEISVLRQVPGIRVFSLEKHEQFVSRMTPEEKQEAGRYHQAYFQQICEMTGAEHWDLLVLDEIIGAVNHGFLTAGQVTAFLRSRPEELEVVMTGRDPLPELTELADYITEMKKVKHPFENGIRARKGIEF